GVLADQLPVLERVLEEPEELVRLEWLLEDVKRAGALRGLHRLAHRAVGSDDEDLERGIAPLQLTGELQAVAVGQHQIHDRGVRIALAERAQRLAHAAGRAHAVALALERHAQAIGDGLLVVDDENHLSALHWSGGLGDRLGPRVAWGGCGPAPHGEFIARRSASPAFGVAGPAALGPRVA